MDISGKWSITACNWSPISSQLRLHQGRVDKYLWGDNEMLSFLWGTPHASGWALSKSGTQMLPSPFQALLAWVAALVVALSGLQFVFYFCCPNIERANGNCECLDFSKKCYTPDGGKMKLVMRLFGSIGILVILLLVLGLAFSSVRIIDAGEVGVKTEFGRVVEVLHPGIYFIIPIMNDVKYMSTQIEKFEPRTTAASKDLQIVDTQIAVNYRIVLDGDRIKQLYERFRGKHELRVINPLVQEVVKSNTAKFNAEELITKRVELKERIATDLEQKLDNYGLEVVEVSITDLNFSPEFNAAIEAKVVAEQKLRKEKIDLETKRISVQRHVLTKNASATAIVIEAHAQADAKKIKAEAEANAIKKITEAITDPYLRYYYVETWDGQMPKVIGDNDLMIGLGDLNQADVGESNSSG